MIAAGRRMRPLGVVLGLIASVGCAAGNAYRKGQKEAKQDNWDGAVAGLTKAVSLSPDNIQYKIALENARIRASRFHYDEAKKQLAAEELDKAAEELQIASNYDPSNQSASDDLEIVRAKIRKRQEDKDRLAQFGAMKARADAVRVPVPVLSPRSPVPITLKFSEQSLQKILESLGKLAGVNLIFDADYRDKRWSVDLSGVTFEEALNQITLVNRLFYKVLDQNTLIVVADSPAKRKIYDDNLIQTFYLENADVAETVQLVKSLSGITKAAGNVSLGAITITGTPDELALASRIIENNDKARGEVMVEVSILEVNRNNLKRYGIELSNYVASVTYAPTGVEGEVAAGFTNVRAHLLSSINLSDFIVSLPSTLFARFLQTDSSVRILATPKLRAAEGKKTSLRVGTEVPIPVTTFTSAAAGGAQTFVPATSFQYRNVGVNLELTPRVNAAGEIVLEMAIEFSQIGEDRNVGSEGNPLIVPTFLTRNVTGVLRVRDGETSLIGGLLSGRDAETLSGVAGISSIPILGKLFTSTRRQVDELEVLISLTPHLVRAPKLSEGNLSAVYIGTKDHTRVLSARPSLFGSPTEATPAAGVAPAPAGPTVAPDAPPPAPAPPGAELEAPAPAPAPHAPARALFSPSEARVKVGDTATVAVVLLGGVGVTSVDVVVAYDASLLEAVEVGPGTLLTLDGQSVGAERKLESGRAQARFTRSTAATGSGAVAVIRFKALSPGTATLGVASLGLTTTSGDETALAQGPAVVVVEP